MKNYLIIVTFFSILIIGIAASYFFVPEVKENFNNLFKNEEAAIVDETYNLTQPTDEPKGDLSIDGYTYATFNQIRIPLKDRYLVENSGDRIFVRVSDNEYFEGRFYKDSQVSLDNLFPGISITGIPELGEGNYFISDYNLIKDTYKVLFVQKDVEEKVLVKLPDGLYVFIIKVNKEREVEVNKTFYNLTLVN